MSGQLRIDTVLCKREQGCNLLSKTWKPFYFAPSYPGRTPQMLWGNRRMGQRRLDREN
jgi:hypothetical protein